MRILFIFFLLVMTPLLRGDYNRATNLWSYEKYSPDRSAQEYFDEGSMAYQKQRYHEALTQLLTIVHHFRETPFLADSLYYTGLCYFHLEHYDLANEQFTDYLDQPGALQYFEEIFELKFKIAEFFRQGFKKHPFGVPTLPRMASAEEDALELYDEIVAALPNQELSVKALYSKGVLLSKRKEYKEAVEELEVLARRFPNHPLAAEGYLKIGEIFLERQLREHQNPDYISMAKLNKLQFEKSFPQDERIPQLDHYIIRMQENQAKLLYETGLFYERKKKWEAAKIYYRDATARYPASEVAKRCATRLNQIEKR